MILTDYYRFSKQDGQRSKCSRLCDVSTHSYSELEGARSPKDRAGSKSRDNVAAGDLRVYLVGTNDHIKATSSRRADVALTLSNGCSLSSLYFPSSENPTKGHGDIRGTQDAFLVETNGDLSVVELFIARGQKHRVSSLFALFNDGEFEDEITQIREAASEDNPAGRYAPRASYKGEDADR